MTRICCIVIIAILNSCLGAKTPARLSRDLEPGFTNKLEGKNTGLSDKLNLKGVYRCEYETPRRNTAYINTIFYEDGTFVTGFHLPDTYQGMQDSLNFIINAGPGHVFYSTGASWGVYSVSGDTIKAQYLMYPNKFTPTYSYEDQYLITGRTSLTFLSMKHGVNSTEPQNWVVNDIQQGKFGKIELIPLDHLPPPDGWIKSRKFFWKNK